MTAYDFEYDGIRLSDIGYTICDFSSSGLDTVTNGSEITFNTTSTLNGTKYEMASYEYGECLTATFDICKTNCEERGLEITVPEFRHLMRWLNRKKYHKLKFIDDEWCGLWYEGSFNVSRIELEGKIVGAELTFTANRPFAMMEEVEYAFRHRGSGEWNFQIKDYSDEEGFIYPYTVITMFAGGDLSIYNDIEDRTTYIGDVEYTEEIIFDYPVITARNTGHSIQDNFNWNFPRIANAFGNRENNFTVSLPCAIHMTYSPVAKMGM